MVDKTRQVDPGKLTAYERWELPNIGGEKAGPRNLTNSAQPKIKPPTAQDIETIRKQAYQAGIEEGRKAGFDKGHTDGLVSGKEQGYTQGLEQGLLAGQTQITQTLARLDALLGELVSPIEKQQTLVEEAMLNVSMAVARAVIHRELSLDSSSIQQAIHLILNDLPKMEAGFSLKVNSIDEPFITPILNRYDSELTLKLDDSITAGGCVLLSSSQLIDYTIEKRFQKTVQSMLSIAMQGNTDKSIQEVPSSIGALSEYPSETLHDIPLDPAEAEIETVGLKEHEESPVSLDNSELTETETETETESENDSNATSEDIKDHDK
ncbi:MAG: flagellar assembly protein FliH [Oleiphilaceae bacterium]|jgi:flagellar assembly protein FliH